mgnify:CR=1 FL=1
MPEGFAGPRRPADTVALDRVGLRRGEPARARPTPRSRWLVGRLAAVYTDGSVLLEGIPRVLTCRVRSETVEIRRPGSRGRLRWVQMRDVAVTWEQLEMW